MFCLHASCTHKDSMCQNVFDFTHKTHTIIKPEPLCVSDGHFISNTFMEIGITKVLNSSHLHQHKTYEK